LGERGAVELDHLQLRHATTLVAALSYVNAGPGRSVCTGAIENAQDLLRHPRQPRMCARDQHASGASGDEHAEGHVAYTPASISAAARWPERTAPSIAPYEIVAVSVPAQ